MAHFEGTLRMAGDSQSLPALVVIDHGSLALTSRDREIGAWRLGDLEIQDGADGFHVRVEGEELILSLLDPTAFAASLAPRREAKPERRWTAWLRQLDGPRLLAAIGGLTLVAMFVFLPLVLALLVLLTGAVIFFAGLFACFDPLFAARLPAPSTPMLTLIAGTGLIVTSALIFSVA